MTIFRFLAAACVFFSATSASFAAETLTADTSHPDSSTFAQGDAITLTFKASGLPPSSQTVLNLEYRDADGVVVSKAGVPVTVGADGRWNGSVTPPSSRLGFYRVFASLADGTTLAAFGSRHAGYLTYAVVPDPNSRVDYGESGDMFGMQGGFSDRVNVLPYLGVRWVLGSYGWGSQEKDHAGEFQENRAKALAAGKEYPEKPDATEGVTYDGKPWMTYVLPSLNGTPTWASVPGTTGTSTGVMNQAGETEWPIYCDEAAKAFAANYPTYTQDLYQTTWEPVYPWGFKGTDAQLVRIYQLAYPALHKADPKALVLGPTDGGIGGSDLAWTEGLLKAGLGKYIDGITIHPYFPLPPERNGLVDIVRRLRATVDQNTGRDLPFYGTEQGYATGEDPAKELLQAQGLVRENLILLGEGFRANFAFYITDYAGEPGYGFYYNLDPKKPFGTQKTGPKPVAAAYAAMTALIDGHRPTETIEYLGATSHGYAFQRGSDVVLALWDFGDKPNTVNLPVGAQSVTVYDWMGNPTVMKPSKNGQITVSLGPEPIYIKGVSPELWGSTARRPLSVPKAQLDVFPGQTVSLRAMAASSGTASGDGSIVLDPDPALHATSRTVSLHLTRTPAPVELPLVLPATIPPGHYMARLSLLENGASVGATGVLLNVQSPVQIAAPLPAFEDGKPLVKADFTNLTTKPITAVATLRLLGLPGARPTSDIQLAPGETRTVSFDCSGLNPSNNRLYASTIAITTGAGYKTSSESNVSFEPLVYASTPPSLDAPLDEWPGAPAIRIGGREDIVRSPRYANGKLSAQAKIAWDANNLYIAFDVVDPVYIQDHTGFGTWQGDCLQLEFNLDPEKSASNTGNMLADAGSIRASEIDLALTTNGPEAYRTATFSPDKAPVRLLTSSEIGLTVKRTPTGLTYRAAIPWKTLGATAPPIPGQRIGFAAYVNDMNQPGQLDPTALGLYVANTDKDPNQFGKLVLQGAER